MEEKITFNVSKDDLLRHLIKVSKSVKDKSTLPVYTYFLFEILGNNLQITGTDTNIQIEASMEVSEPSGDMNFCVDKSIIDILKTLPEQPLEIGVTKTEEMYDKMKIVKVNVNIIHSSGNIVLNGFDCEYFTKMKEVKGKGLNIQASNLKRGLNKTKKFAANDVQKPIVTSVFFDIQKDYLAFAATDNKIVSRFIDHSIKESDADSFILDLNSVNILSALLDGLNDEIVTICANENNVLFDISGLKMTSRLIEGKYLNYNRVFKDSLPIELTAGVKYLSNVINRLLNASDNSSMIRVETGIMQTHLSAKDLQMNKSADESIDCECNGEMIIGMQGKQMLDMLSVIDGNVILSFSDPLSPIQLVPEKQEEETSLTLLVMPMKLD